MHSSAAVEINVDIPNQWFANLSKKAAPVRTFIYRQHCARKVVPLKSAKQIILYARLLVYNIVYTTYPWVVWRRVYVSVENAFFVQRFFLLSRLVMLQVSDAAVHESPYIFIAQFAYTLCHRRISIEKKDDANNKSQRVKSKTILRRIDNDYNTGGTRIFFAAV